MLLDFPAAVVATKVFKIIGRGEFPIDIWSTNWGTASLTITVDRKGLGTYHDLSPATDPTDPLTGAPFTVDGNLTTSLVLGDGHYGITITNTPTAPIFFHICHKYVLADANTGDYGA